MPGVLDKINRYLLVNSKVPLAEKMFFADNLRVMIHAGLSMSEALNTLALQAESKAFRQMLTEVKEGVSEGRLLSVELARFPKAFPNVFIKMIEIGEISGTLEDTLKELATQIKKDYDLRSKVKGAMMYPIVIMIAMIGITIGLLIFVLPKLLQIFKDFGDIQLPLSTRILIFASDAAQEHGLLILGALIILGVLFSLLLKTKKGTSLYHLFIISIPGVGPLAKKVNLARFSRTLSSLLKTDVPVIKSLNITSAVITNVHYRAIIDEAAESIKKGNAMTDTLKKYPKLFPPLIVQMTLVGERSGNIDGLLGDVANFYESQVDAALDNLSSIIEPVLILMLGGMVGGIALAVMTPMYSLTESVSSQ